MSKEPDLKDLFLDESLLIELARRELKGRLPPEQLPPQPSTLISSGKKSKLAREIEGRGWTARDLAEQIGVPSAEANALIRGGQKITPELARRLGLVFATSSEYWLSDED